MLTRSVRWTYFLGISGYAKYLKLRETRKFHAFLCLYKNENKQLINQISN